MTGPMNKAKAIRVLHTMGRTSGHSDRYAVVPATRDRKTGRGAPCPKCGSSLTAVTDSRPAELWVHRRRHCLDCSWRFGTYEISGDIIDAFRDLADDAELASAVAKVARMVGLEVRRDAA